MIGLIWNALIHHSGRLVHLHNICNFKIEVNGKKQQVNCHMELECLACHISKIIFEFFTSLLRLSNNNLKNAD